MRISDLSHATGVPVPTIKFYLREGILPFGRGIATNQAEYGEDHVRRLRLIRALAEVGGLPLATVRDVLGAVDDPGPPIHDALGIATARWPLSSESRAIRPSPRPAPKSTGSLRSSGGRYRRMLLPAVMSSPSRSRHCGAWGGRTRTPGCSSATRTPPTGSRLVRSNGPRRPARREPR